MDNDESQQVIELFFAIITIALTLSAIFSWAPR